MRPNLKLSSSASLPTFGSAVTQKGSILSALATYGKRPEDVMSIKEMTAILTRKTNVINTSNTTLALTPEQVKQLYKVTDPAGSDAAPCELIAATWSREPLDRALLMRNTFYTCDFDQSGTPSPSPSPCLQPRVLEAATLHDTQSRPLRLTRRSAPVSHQLVAGRASLTPPALTRHDR